MDVSATADNRMFIMSMMYESNVHNGIIGRMLFFVLFPFPRVICCIISINGLRSAILPVNKRLRLISRILYIDEYGDYCILPSDPISNELITSNPYVCRGMLRFVPELQAQGFQCKQKQILINSHVSDGAAVATAGKTLINSLIKYFLIITITCIL